MYNTTQTMEKLSERLDLDKPRFDQSTFAGRLKHFTLVTSPFKVFASPEQLRQAEQLVQAYKLVAAESVT